MERSPTRVKDKETDRVLDFIFNNAMGSPIIFTAAPTLAQMKGNTWGKYSNTLYLKFADGKGISIAGSALI